MLKAFVNVWKVPELRRRILFTLGILALCRLAATVPCPGIDSDQLARLFDELQKNTGDGGGGTGILGMFDLFSGGALKRFAVGALGVMPYITSSIIFSLLTPVIGKLERLKREGESGQQKLNQYTRYLTLAICVVQGWMAATIMERAGGIAGGIQPVIQPGLGFRFMTMVILTCGTMLLMWMGEQITDRGIGNGVSLIITIGIVERLPQALYSLWDLLLRGESNTQPFTIIHVLILIALFLVVVAGVVALTVGVRKVPIEHARTRAGRMGTTSNRSFFPLRVNYAGVMPIIFASALLSMPPMVIQWVRQFPWLQWTTSLSPWFTYGNLQYIVLYSAMVIVFCFFWVANQFNPLQIADDLKRSGAYIPGVRPGKPTAEFLDYTMTRVTTAGAVFLLIIAILPMVFSGMLGVPVVVASFFGGTSILIMVGVMLDTMRQIEATLLMHGGYEGFIGRGRLRSRRG